MIALERRQAPPSLADLFAGWAARPKAEPAPPAQPQPQPFPQVRIVTDRLVLRPHRSDDFEGMRRLVCDPATFEYSERGPMSGEEAWSMLLRHAGHWALAGYGVFAIEEKATGRFVGQVGPSDFHRRFGSDFDPYPEMCWSIVRRCRGRGYATEAAAAALDWLHRAIPADRTVCLIHEDNAPSFQVAARLGYRPFRFRRYRDYSAVLLERPA